MRVRILRTICTVIARTMLRARQRRPLSFLALYGAVFIRFEVGVRTLPQLEQELGPLWPRAVALSAIVMACLLAVGLYSSRQRVQLSGILARLMVALLASSCAMVAFFYAVPSLRLGRGVAALAVTLVLCGVVASRLIFARVADEEIFKRRVLVYGAGSAATAIARLRRANDRHGFTLAGFVKPPGEPPAVPTERVLEAGGDLRSLCGRLGVTEIVVAMDDRRRAFPDPRACLTAVWRVSTSPSSSLSSSAKPGACASTC